MPTLYSACLRTRLTRQAPIRTALQILLLVSLVGLPIGLPASAQECSGIEVIQGDSTYRISGITVETLWRTIDDPTLDRYEGEFLTGALLSDVNNAARDLVQTEQVERTAIIGASERFESPKIAILFVEPCLGVNRELHSVAIRVKAYQVTIDRDNPLRGLVQTAAANTGAANFLLDAVRPRIEIATPDSDRVISRAGAEIDISHLLDPDSRIIAEVAGAYEPTFGRKGSSGGSARVALGYQFDGSLLDRVRLSGSLSDNLERTNGALYRSDQTGLQFSLGIMPLSNVSGRYTLYGEYAHHDFAPLDPDSSIVPLTTLDAIEAGIIADAVVAGGALRLHLHSSSIHDSTNARFDRWSLTSAYGKDLSVSDLTGDTHDNLGIELLVGGGIQAGDITAAYAAGSNTESDHFLYREHGSLVASRTDWGPLIRGRSSGTALHGEFSGTRSVTDWYTHANLTLSIPIPGLSQPLIPVEEVYQDENGEPVHLNRILKSLVLSGRNSYKAILKRKGLSQEEAASQADTLFESITPTVEYIADQANLWEIKPLLLVDAVAYTAEGFEDPLGEMGLGLGVQGALVSAKLEAGYMWAFSNALHQAAGRVFFRFYVTDVFRLL